MRKGKIIKRTLAILLIFLLNINSFAAVVSDNDGSAFITKAEFDSLKNNFQSQIDAYNTSIDSKIDGAIAQYLVGISIKSTRFENTLINMSGGILSIVDDQVSSGVEGSYKPGCMPWVYGNVGWNASAVITALSASPSIIGGKPEYVTHKIGIVRDPAAHKIRLIKNWNETNKEAIWLGYSKVKDMVTGNNVRYENRNTVDHPHVGFITTGAWAQPAAGSGTASDPYILYSAWDCYPNYKDSEGKRHPGAVIPISDDRTPLTDKTIPFLNVDFSDPGYTSGSWDGLNVKLNTNQNASHFYYQLTPNDLSFSRTVESVENQYVIVCDNSRSHFVHRINDSDIVSAWCSEKDNEYNTSDLNKVGTHSMNNYLSSGFYVQTTGFPRFYRDVLTTPVVLENGYRFTAPLNTAAGSPEFHFMVKTYKWTSYNSTGSGVEHWSRTQRPYFGFLDALDDWRMLANNFEDISLPLDEIITMQPIGEVAYTNVAGNTLMVGAGMPLFKMKRGEEYIFRMKVNSSNATNETGNYHIWFKIGTFTKDKAPDDENNLIFDSEKTTVSGKKCYEMIPGQNYEFTFKPDKDGYIFCKWQNAAIGGGGILNVEREVEVIAEN